MNKYDSIGIAMAQKTAELGTCRRKKVGVALISSTGRYLGGGYNTSLDGHPTCLEIGCQVIDNHCERTVHAEVIAICNIAKTRKTTLGCTIYVTLQPCMSCFKVIAAAGIGRIVFAEQYGSLRLDDDCKKLGIELVHFKESQ